MSTSPFPHWIILLARVAAARAYAPYSRCRVGAAVLCESGRVYTGCNVEDAAYTGTHAECNAVAAYVAAGERSAPVALVCLRADSAQLLSPCGHCRQQMFEVFGPDLTVLTDAGPMRLAELLPLGFSATSLPR